MNDSDLVALYRAATAQQQRATSMGAEATACRRAVVARLSRRWPDTTLAGMLRISKQRVGQLKTETNCEASMNVADYLQQQYNLGRIGYEAYGEHVGWKAHDGSDMQQNWDLLPHRIQSAWMAAAYAVTVHVRPTNATNDEGR